MSPIRNRSLPRLVVGIALAAGLLVLVVSLGPRAEAADDIDLLRERGGQPFVQILLDTSGSMTLSPPGQGGNQHDFGDFVPANGDDPRSKLFQVKKAMYEVFSKVENVSFGFAGYNQDRLRVRAKHWLYRAAADGAFGSGSSSITFPQQGEEWVFGAHYPSGNPGVAGTCNSPLDLSNDRVRLSRFAKLGITGAQTTVLWIEDRNKTHRVTVAASGGAGVLGSQQIQVQVTDEVVTTCLPINLTEPESVTVTFNRLTDFLMIDGQSGGFDDDVCTGEEFLDPVWGHTDVEAQGTCGAAEGGPFTGQGWEGNTDSGARPFDPYDHPFVDQCCVDIDDPSRTCLDVSNRDSLADEDLPDDVVCYNTRFPTSLDPEFPVLDSGDHVPMDWDADHREEFLKRLNPRHPEYLPEILWDDDPSNGEASPDQFIRYFGLANYFQNTPDSSGILQLKSEQERPIVGVGNSPLARAINDFRCWVQNGKNDKKNDDNVGGKCRGRFNRSWNDLFRENDLWYNCRVPYLVIVSDGEDNSEGENSSADVAAFLNKSGVRTFVFSFNETATLRSIVNPGGGEFIQIQNGEDFKEKLEEIIGEIQQEARTFASAAVPSVQSSVADKIFLTNFRPLNDAGIWEGHFHAFLRPLTTSPPSTDDPNHLWDGAVELLAQAPSPGAADLQLGPGVNERRIYYAKQRIPGDPALGSWGKNRQAFNRTDNGASPGEANEPLELDFWDGLEIPVDPMDEDSVKQARARANRIVEETVYEKSNPAVAEDPDALDPYILGETFHSDPLIVGSPPNTQYFVSDAEETFDGDGDELGTGYREFFNRHENRRKVVLAGANDGQLHAFDAGKAEVITFVDDFGIQRKEVRFDDGSGREIFSYMPRAVLPTVKAIAENPEAHRWSVDGTVAAGDVFIDPLHAGTPDGDGREWRTVLIGGLREGGSGYYALDVTQPDELKEDTVGPTGDAEAQRDILLPVNQDVVPGCHTGTGGGGLGCDENLPYPAPLWEFHDEVWSEEVDEEYVPLDEDGNGFVDLGETWSAPDIGRIKVVDRNGSTVNKYVAIFGGGLDPAKSGARGNFLYFVDVETGETIYKRRVQGSAPADPAAVDLDQDGFFDRVYIGTTAGIMYRVDLNEIDNDGNVILPRLVAETVTGIDGIGYDTVRIEKGMDPADPLWAPQAIFDTGGRPVYFAPAVLFVAELGEFALAFGTGDRDDLTSITGPTGRFYVFVDESHLIDEADLPMTEGRFEEITIDEGDNPDLLTDPNDTTGERGWYLVLEQDERLIGNPFGFSGITFFSTYNTNEPEPTCDVTKKSCENPLCALAGDSRIYLVGTTDADAFLEDANGETRFATVEGQFVTSPFTEQAVTANPIGDGDGDGDVDGPADPLDDAEKKLMEKLVELFPRECKFGNHRIDVKVIAANTEIRRIAAVPICIVEKNWKELTR